MLQDLQNLPAGGRIQISRGLVADEQRRPVHDGARNGDALLFKGSRGMRMEKALALFFKEEEE